MNIVFYNPKLDKIPKNILNEILELNQDNKPALGGIDSLIHLEKLYKNYKHNLELIIQKF